ncbi:MAG TPA: hypothetical protein DIW44_12460 [Anaerolineaceae bacterium]|nr:hypothetical protein [Anaerolineaceae bacterium]
MDEKLEVQCPNPNCRAQLGYIVMIENLEWLQMGGGIARQWHGVCAKCGKEFHWSVSDRILEKIIKQALKD